MTGGVNVVENSLKKIDEEVAAGGKCNGAEDLREFFLKAQTDVKNQEDLFKNMESKFYGLCK